MYIEHITYFILNQSQSLKRVAKLDWKKHIYKWLKADKLDYNITIFDYIYFQNT